jgi:hypothetical protein
MKAEPAYQAYGEAPGFLSVAAGQRVSDAAPNRRFAVLSVSAVSLYLSAFRLPWTPIVMASDQWINIHGAVRMAHGERIYGSFFQYTWPGTETLYAAIIGLFGIPVWLPGALSILVGLAFVELGIRLSHRVQLGAAAVLPGLLYLAFARADFDTTHHKFSILLVLAATVTLLSGQDLVRVAVTGVLIGAAAFFTQTRSICLLPMAGFMLWKSRQSPLSRRRIAAQQAVLLLSYGLVVAVLLWSYIEPVGLRKFMELTFEFPLRYYRTASNNNWSFYMRPVPRLGSALMVCWLTIHALVPWIYLLFFIAYRRELRNQSSSQRDGLVLIALVGLSLFLSVGYAPVFARLSEIPLPAMVLAVWMVRQNRYRQIGTAGMWGAVCVGFLALAVKAQTRDSLKLQTPSGTVAVVMPKGSPKSMVAASWIASHTKPGDMVFVADHPTLYTVLGLTNPTELPFISASAYTPPKQVAEAVADMEKHQPQYIVWDDNFDLPDADGPGDALAPLRTFLSQRYAVVKEFSDGQRILAPRQPVDRAEFSRADDRPPPPLPK